MTSLTHTGTVVQPHLDHQVDEANGRYTYYAKTSGRFRYTVASMLLVPCFFALLAAIFVVWVSFVTPGGYTGGSVLVLLAVVGAIIALCWWGFRAKTVPVVFDEKSITVEGKTYLLDHVTQIGWNASGGYIATTGAAAHGAAIGYALSGYIYIQYGNKTIPIIKGLHPDRVEIVYADIARFLRQVGRPFGN